MQTGDTRPGDSPSSTPPPQAPSLEEAVRRIGAAGESLGAEVRDAGGALWQLFRAELALSRGALLRMLLLSALGIALGSTAWLYLMMMVALGLRELGLQWWAAVGVPALISLGGVGVCVLLVMRAWDDARFSATRRQLTRLRHRNESEDTEKSE